MHTPDAKPLLRKLETITFIANHILGWYTCIFKNDLPGLVAHHGLILHAEPHARRVHIDEKAGYSALRAFRTICCGHQLDIVRFAGPRDKSLGAVDDIIIAITYRRCAH